MKKITFVLGMMVCASFLANAQAVGTMPISSATVAVENPNAPEALYEQEILDYGTVEYDSEGTREFKFKNTGKTPLIIYSATGSCQCTVPDAPKEPIKPGETGIIKVHYNTKREGSFEKTVTVSSNGRTPSKILKIRGVVKAAPAPAASGSVTVH